MANLGYPWITWTSLPSYFRVIFIQPGYDLYTYTFEWHPWHYNGPIRTYFLIALLKPGNSILPLFDLSTLNGTHDVTEGPFILVSWLYCYNQEIVFPTSVCWACW